MIRREEAGRTYFLSQLGIQESDVARWIGSMADQADRTAHWLEVVFYGRRK